MIWSYVTVDVTQNKWKSFFHLNFLFEKRRFLFIRLLYFIVTLKYDNCTMTKIAIIFHFSTFTLFKNVVNNYNIEIKVDVILMKKMFSSLLAGGSEVENHDDDGCE